MSEDTTASGTAEQLFIERALDSGAELPAAASVALVRQICRDLDGLPLALELAAARAADLPLATLADAIRRNTPVLDRGAGPARQRSLDAVVEWSLRDMPAGEHAALLALSAMPAAFDLDVASAILGYLDGADADAVPALRRRSLLDLDGVRYRMLTVVRRVVARRLDQEAGSADLVHDAMYRWARDYIAGPNPSLPPGDRDFYLLMEEICTWAVPRGLPGTGRILTVTVSWSKDYPATERLTAICEAAVLSPPPADAADLVLIRAAALSRRGGAYLRTDTGSWTRPLVDQLVADARHALTGEDLARAMGPATRFIAQDGDLEGSAVLNHEILTIEGTTLENRLLASLNLGVARHLQGRFDDAEKCYRTVLSQPIPERPALEWRSVGNLAELLIDRGDPEAALDLLQPRLNRTQGIPVAAPFLALYAEALIKTGRACPPELIDQALSRLHDAVGFDSSITFYIDRLREVLSSSDARRSPSSI